MASIARHRGVGATALKSRDFFLLLSAMLVASAGNTALQSVMPAISRTIGVDDFYVAATTTWSSVLWVVFAPFWAEKSDHHGRKALTLVGLGGFIASNILSGLALFAGLHHWIGNTLTFALFALFRGMYGAIGCATSSATQAYLASKTRRSGRVAALSSLSSTSGLGTIIGPAVAPLFILPVVGLAGPMLGFVLIGAMVFASIHLWLPNDRSARRIGRGAPTSYPSIAAPPTGASVIAATSPRPHKRLSWKDPRINGWILAGILSGSAQAGTLVCLGFFVIDTLHLTASASPGEISIVMMSGAVATLGAQSVLIPRLGLKSRSLIIWGALIAAAGLVVTMLAADLYGITLGFIITSTGFGFTRPGFTAGASISVSMGEQGAVAGLITAANGINYVFAPALGIIFYEWQHKLPFAVFALLLVGLAAFARRRLVA